MSAGGRWGARGAEQLARGGGGAPDLDLALGQLRFEVVLFIEFGVDLTYLTRASFRVLVLFDEHY